MSAEPTVDTLAAVPVAPVTENEATYAPVVDIGHEAEWGWLPALSIVAACGLLLVSLADTAARNGIFWAQVLFWVGVLVLFFPVAARLTSADTRRESMGLVLVLGIGLYIVKVLHSPIAFTFHDEFAHLRTAQDIFTSGHLFHENPLQPVSALYPDLEIVTTALAHLSGLPIFIVGLIVLGLARLLLVLALYLLFLQVSGSTRVAGIGAALYMANPNFVFWSAQFSYESLALPIAVLVLYLLVRRQQHSAPGRLGLTFLIFPLLAVVITTHHLTSYLLAGFLCLWEIAAYWLRRRGAVDRTSPGLLAVLTLVGSAVWLIYVATITVGYLAPHFEGAILELARNILSGQLAGRQLFHSSTGTVSPLWERLTGIASAGFILLAMPLGLWGVWRRFRDRAIAVVLAIGALGYPASLAFRFTGQGWEIANRASESLFVALSFVLAVGTVHLWLRRPFRRTRSLVFVLWASVIFTGGIIAGWPPSWRLPGPYLVADGPRSIDTRNVSASRWVRAYLGPNNHVAADSIDNLLLGSYGEQNIEITLNGGVDVSYLFLATQIGPQERALIRQGKIRYAVVDRRLTTGRPWGVQFDGTSPRIDKFLDRPVAPQLFTKFDRAPKISRIFDNGAIQIFDVGAIARGH